MREAVGGGLWPEMFPTPERGQTGGAGESVDELTRRLIGFVEYVAKDGRLGGCGVGRDGALSEERNREDLAIGFGSLHHEPLSRRRRVGLDGA